MGVKERKNSLYFHCLLNHGFWVILKSRHNLSNKKISRISLLRIFFWDLPRFPYNCLIIPAFLQNMKGGHKEFSICGALRGCFINCTFKKSTECQTYSLHLKIWKVRNVWEGRNRIKEGGIKSLGFRFLFLQFSANSSDSLLAIVFHIITLIFLPVKTHSGQEWE